MATTDNIESLHKAYNIFELKEDTVISFIDEENVYVESIGDLVILAMDNQNGEKLKDSFLNLSK